MFLTNQIPILLGVLLLWLSGARAWDFFPSVTFNVPYATSLGNSMARPTGADASRNNVNNGNVRNKQALPPAPAAAAVAMPDNDVLRDILGDAGVGEGIVA